MIPKITGFLMLLLQAFTTNGFVNLKLDSLWAAWRNETLADSSRLNAIYSFTWEGFLYSQPDSAFYYAQQLHDFALRKGHPNWIAKALNLQGNSFVVRGEYFNAFKYYNNSLVVSEKTGDQKERANSLHSLGIIYYYQGDHPRALDFYLRSLKIRETINDKQGIGKSLNNIGIVYSEQKQFSNAIDYFRRSLLLSREMNDVRGEASTLNNVGLIYKEEGNLDSAFTFYGQSLSISESLDDKRDIAVALTNIGNIYEQKKDYEKALDFYIRATQLKEQVGDLQSKSLSLNDIGNLYQIQKNYKSAIEYCLKGLKLAEQIGSLVNQETACLCLYQNYKMINNQGKALEYHERMLALNDSIKDTETMAVLQHMEFAQQVLADSIAKADERMKIRQAHEAEVRRKNQTRNALLVLSFCLLIGGLALVNRYRYIRKSRAEISREKDRSENLLLNILPGDIARELKENGKATPRKFENVSILFTDFKDFTQQASKLSPEELISELNACFMEFDAISEKYHLEKIKTIGDAYMVAGGLPVPSKDSAMNTVLAALTMTSFLEKRKTTREAEGKFAFEMRAGIHTGTVVAGIVGSKKFQYDIYGDTVNLASRMEAAGEPGKVNISKETYELIKDNSQFMFKSRGQLMVKGKGCTEMFYVEQEL